MAMKFRAHDTFFIRKGWLNKGMKYVNFKPDVFVDKEENPMDVLGIGSNMVKALRYWLQAVGLTQEPNHGRRIQHLPGSENVFLKMTDMSKNLEHFICFTTSLYATRMKQLHGIISLMNFLCQNLQKRILLQHFKIMY